MFLFACFLFFLVNFSFTLSSHRCRLSPESLGAASGTGLAATEHCSVPVYPCYSGGLFCLDLPPPYRSSGIRDASCPCLVLCGFWEFELRSSHLHGSHFPTEPSLEPGVIFRGGVTVHPGHLNSFGVQLLSISSLSLQMVGLTGR